MKTKSRKSNSSLKRFALQIKKCFFSKKTAEHILHGLLGFLFAWLKGLLK